MKSNVYKPTSAGSVWQRKPAVSATISPTSQRPTTSNGAHNVSGTINRRKQCQRGARWCLLRHVVILCARGTRQRVVLRVQRNEWLRRKARQRVCGGKRLQRRAACLYVSAGNAKMQCGRINARMLQGNGTAWGERCPVYANSQRTPPNATMRPKHTRRKDANAARVPRVRGSVCAQNRVYARCHGSMVATNRP